MLGVYQPSEATLEYCCSLITEYTALDCAQVLTLLKRYGGLSRRDRNRVAKLMCQSHARKMEAGGNPHAHIMLTRNGGRCGQNSAIGRWSSMDTRSALTTAIMNRKG